MFLISCLFLKSSRSSVQDSYLHTGSSLVLTFYDAITTLSRPIFSFLFFFPLLFFSLLVNSYPSAFISPLLHNLLLVTPSSQQGGGSNMLRARLSEHQERKVLSAHLWAHRRAGLVAVAVIDGERESHASVFERTDTFDSSGTQISCGIVEIPTSDLQMTGQTTSFFLSFVLSSFIKDKAKVMIFLHCKFFLDVKALTVTTPGISIPALRSLA